MVGLIQKVLLDFVEQKHGSAVAAEILRRAGVAEDRRFRLDTVYSDDEFQRLLQATCETLGVTQDAVEIAYADFFGRDAVRRWPVWFETSTDARHLLERQQVIHNTFATGVRDPAARRGIIDKFRIEKLPDGLETHYRSPNALCGLYKGLAQWVLDYYNESAVIEETHCTKHGDPECIVRIRWPSGAAA